MRNDKPIELKGIVETIENGIVTVNITALSACASCHVQGSCSVGDMENKVIEVKDSTNSYREGEFVNVIMSQALGYKALFYGYILPFLIILFVLIIATQTGLGEGAAGLLALAPLPFYYLALYLLKDKLKDAFSLKINKL